MVWMCGRGQKRCWAQQGCWPVARVQGSSVCCTACHAGSMGCKGAARSMGAAAGRARVHGRARRLDRRSSSRQVGRRARWLLAGTSGRPLVPAWHIKLAAGHRVCREARHARTLSVPGAVNFAISSRHWITATTGHTTSVAELYTTPSCGARAGGRAVWGQGQGSGERCPHRTTTPSCDARTGGRAIRARQQERRPHWATTRPCGARKGVQWGQGSSQHCPHRATTLPRGARKGVQWGQGSSARCPHRATSLPRGARESVQEVCRRQ